MPDVRKSYCRICQAFCGMKVTVEDGRIVGIRGDKADPVSQGYACFKGLQSIEHHYGSGRLIRSLRRRDGVLEPAESDTVLNEAGQALRRIVDAHGPEAVGFYTGTQALFNAPIPGLMAAFAAALGTPRLFTTMTIDQSAKWIAESRLGSWEAGPQQFQDADVWMFIGSNPLISMVSAGGASHLAFPNPVKTVKMAKARGMKLIVVDPRRSETARFADLHLRPRPGRDCELAASLLHTILGNGWHDEAFCREHVTGLEELRVALEPFAPSRCADHIGVTESEIRQAAQMFARDARTGMAGSGTGPDMARNSNVAEHMIELINVVCGRFPRAGEVVANPGVLQSERRPSANVVPPSREWESGPRTVSHSLGRIKGTVPSAEITDEILYSGPGRLRALVCVGGNLAAALPDQRRAMKALSALDLLLVVDPRLTTTARLAHFVVAPTLHYERSDHTGPMERLFQVPFGSYTPSLVAPPIGADVVDESYALWSVAKSAGVQLSIGDQPLALDAAPSREWLLDLLAKEARVPLAVVRSNSGGGIYGDSRRFIAPRTTTHRFELMSADVAMELAEVVRELGHRGRESGDGRQPFQLIVRRHREVMNSLGTDFESTQRRYPGNPAYLHPDDARALKLSPGNLVQISRNDRSILACVRLDGDLRRGTVAVGHGWFGHSSRPFDATNALVDAEEAQSINRMPAMTGIAVWIRRVEQSSFGSG